MAGVSAGAENGSKPPVTRNEHDRRRCHNLRARAHARTHPNTHAQMRNPRVHTGRASDNAPSLTHVRACVRAGMQVCIHARTPTPAAPLRSALCKWQYPEAKPSQGEDERRCAHLLEALKRLAASGDEHVRREERGDCGDHRCKRSVRQHLPRRRLVTVRPFQSFPAPGAEGYEVTLSGRARAGAGAHPCEQRRRPAH